jgi:hypothetical protein
MTDDEYRTFLEYLFQQYVAPRRDRLFGLLGDSRMFGYVMSRLRAATQIVNYATGHCRDDEELYKTYRLEKLRDVIRDVREPLSSLRQAVEEAGFLNAIGEHLEPIIDGMAAARLPTDRSRCSTLPW